MIVLFFEAGVELGGTPYDADKLLNLALKHVMTPVGWALGFKPFYPSYSSAPACASCQGDAAAEAIKEL